MSSGKLLLGAMAGLAAGALLGILFAPDKGSVTRKAISKKAGDYTEDLKKKFNEIIESITERFEMATEGDEVGGPVAGEHK